VVFIFFFFFSSRRRHTRCLSDWSSDVCSSDLWQLLCEEKGAVLRVAPIDDDGQLLVDELQRMLGPRTRLLALAHVSNTLGTINRSEERRVGKECRPRRWPDE